MKGRSDERALVNTRWERGHGCVGDDDAAGAGAKLEGR